MFSLSQFPLPFTQDALSPYMSQETLRCHHGRHLATYIKNLNDLIVGTAYADMPLYDIILNSLDDPSGQKIYNNAAQVFNHDFFFYCLKRNGDTQLPYEIARHFGGAEHFAAQFKAASASVFGSGWVWLVQNDGGFDIITTVNADTPIAHGLTPVLTLDVWEHAYYLDYQNKRAEYTDVFLTNLINWEFVLENIQK